MVDAAQLRSAASDAVVRPLSRVAERPCARPGCPAPARATLTFRYASREAALERLADESSPQAYDLCATHASRTQPPHGWRMRDRRPEEERAPDVPPATPADLGGERTVAVLAAALRQAPDPRPAPGDRGRAAEVAPVGDIPRPADQDASTRVPRPRGVLLADDRPEDAASPVLGPGGPSTDPDPLAASPHGAAVPTAATPPTGEPRRGAVALARPRVGPGAVLTATVPSSTASTLDGRGCCFLGAGRPPKAAPARRPPAGREAVMTRGRRP